VSRPVDVRVALVSYFLDVVPKLRNPKVIELHLLEQTQASTYRDELTGLCNFRLFKEHLDREIYRGGRFGTALSLLMIDVDEFKTYNDHNGHEAGNEALATIASLIAKGLRKVDVAARFGGEDFTLILPSTGESDALKVAERARLAIENEVFPFQHYRPDAISRSA
jgi:diguanylate cyclase (GGDEF)-like protein